MLILKMLIVGVKWRRSGGLCICYFKGLVVSVGMGGSLLCFMFCINIFRNV